MSTITDAIDKARSDAQDLHKKIMAATSKDQAAIKADFENVAASAQQLAASLRKTAETQQPNAKQYLDNAALRMQDAASHARDAVQAAAPEFARAKAKVVGDVTDGLNNVSYAVAAKRTAQEPVRA